jgi:hypothetical protein
MYEEVQVTMRLKIIAGAFVLMAMFAATGAAQQDPLDEGNADSCFFVISEPVVGLVDQVITAELYFYNDAQDIANMSTGWGWDNPNVVIEWCDWSPEADTSFNMMKLWVYRANFDTTNFYRFFQATGMRMMGPGLVAADASHLVATFTFRASTWSETDQFCIFKADHTPTAFADAGNNEYPPIVDGPFCVGNVPTGVLEVDPAELDFFGVAGGNNPSMQTFMVTEASSDNIAFDLDREASWLGWNSSTGTTPHQVNMFALIDGLAPGDYVDSVHVTSAAATNDVWVRINLHLDVPNQPPVLAPIGNRSGPENSLIEFTISASDPDGGFPSLDVYGEPASATFTDNGNGTGTFSWMTTYDDAGEYSMTFIANDGESDDQETINITVTNVNRMPSLDPVANQQVLEGVNLSFLVTASDPDMEALTMTAAPLPGTASYTDHGDGTATFDWTPANTDAGSYGVTFTVADADDSDDLSITIQVIDADGFILNPNPLVYSADFGAPNPASQLLDIAVSDGTMINYTVSTDAAWFSLSAAGGETPSGITVHVDITGLAAGFHRDSVLVSGGELDDAYGYVELTVSNNLVVDPVAITFTVSEGYLFPSEHSINISEMGGDAIAYEATCEAAWLTFAMGTEAGMTPGVAQFASLPNDRPGPGEYNTTILITGAAINSPISIPVSMTVTACPTLAPAESVYDFEIFAGETVMFDETVSLTSSGPGEIDWETTASMAWTLAPAGTTPGDLDVHYEQMFDTEGLYADTAYVSAVVTPIYSCPSQVRIITNVTVNRPPSADTIIVVNTPAVPGMRLSVPIIFTNSCQLNSFSLVLAWDSDDVHFDSMSFVGSTIEYVDDKDYHVVPYAYWSRHQVAIHANTSGQQPVPIGSEQLMGNLHFSLSCEIPEGTYPFEIGEDSSTASIVFARDCGEGEEIDFPEYIPGAIIVGTASNYVCGYVVDPFDNEITGATVELWEDYPFTEPLSSTMSSGIGGFAFDEIMVIPFDLYAHKEGYYPGVVEDINFGDLGVKIVLQPIPEMLVPTTHSVDYYCPDGGNIFMSAPVPVGAIVEAYTQTGLLVGQKKVSTSGIYGFMPVNAAWEEAGDIGAMPGDMIRFTINGMDALATGNTTYPDFSIYERMEVCLEVRGTVEKVCTLFDGWNLISWNVNTETDNILTVLEPVMEHVDVILGFEQGGLTFDPDLQAFSTLWDVDHYSGYWVRIEGVDEVALTITGLPVMASTPIALTAGWNLVSYLPEVAWPTETALGAIQGQVQFAYGFPSGNIAVWSPSGGAFNGLDLFAPCGGYWIKTTGDCWLTYEDLDPVTAAPRTPQTTLAASSSIAQTNWVNLYSENLSVDDQVVTTGTTVTAHSVKNDDVVGTFEMKTDGQFGFMPVYAGVAGESVNGLQAGDEFYLAINDVKTNEIFTWTNNGDRIEVAELSTGGSIGEVLPTGYSLAQNYPNPFNPNTSIAFNMPATGRAKIEIFNVLGRSIGIIFDGQAQAGRNDVVWDGRDADGGATASGVYFYRLTSDDYTETRKMMLLK